MACGSISESETVTITPPAKPSEKAIVRWRGRRTSSTTSPPSPVESPASVVSVRANNIISIPFLDLWPPPLQAEYFFLRVRTADLLFSF